jgi:hypothetical protein
MVAMAIESVRAAMPPVAMEQNIVANSFDSALRRASLDTGMLPPAQMVGESGKSLLSTAFMTFDSILSEQTRTNTRAKRLADTSRTIPGMSEGDGVPKAFDGDKTKNMMAAIDDAVTSATEVAGFVVRIQIVQKAVQGCQRVVDTLTRGQ